MSVAARGSCPAAAEVARHLQRALPVSRVYLGTNRGERVRVIDRGDAFEVDVQGSGRLIGEPSRDCTERARVAAVHAALILDPPQIILDSTPKTPEPESVPPSQHQQTPANQATAWDAMGLVGVTGNWASSASRRFAAGPLLGFGFGYDAVAAHVTFAGLSLIRLDFGGASADVFRAPGSLTLSARHRNGPIELGVGLGLAFDVLHIEGGGVSSTDGGTRLQLGPRLASYGRFRLGERWGLYSQFGATYHPSTYDLEVTPTGIVGHTPSAWLEFVVGATFEVF